MNMRCPKCGRLCEPAGDIVQQGPERRAVGLVYQCDVCTEPKMMDGVTFDAALSFITDLDGRPLDSEMRPLDPAWQRSAN